MAKNKKQPQKHMPRQHEQKNEQALGSLKDLLNQETINKLKSHADALKQQEHDKVEAEKHARDEARKAEQKRLDNNFEYLLNNSDKNWKNYK